MGKRAFQVGDKVRGMNPEALFAGDPPIYNEGKITSLSFNVPKCWPWHVIPCYELEGSVVAAGSCQLLEAAPPKLPPLPKKGDRVRITKAAQGTLTSLRHVGCTVKLVADATFVPSLNEFGYGHDQGGSVKLRTGLGHREACYAALDGFEILRPPAFVPSKGDWVRVATLRPADQPGDASPHPVGHIFKVDNATASVKGDEWAWARPVGELRGVIGTFEKLEHPPLPKAGDWIRITDVGDEGDPHHVVGKPVKVVSSSKAPQRTIFGCWLCVEFEREVGTRRYWIADYEPCSEPAKPAIYVPRAGELVRVVSVPPQSGCFGRIGNWQGVKPGAKFYVYECFSPSRGDRYCIIHRDGFSGGIELEVEPVRE